MPTNILRQQSAVPAGERPPPAPSAPRVAVIEVGGHKIRAKLADTRTAARIWAALPLFSTAETRGHSIHFEIPVKTGRERNARLIVQAGDICFCSEDDQVLIGFGPTPISPPNEIRLMHPCNIWAQALDDVSVLKSVTPGEKVSIRAAN